MEELELKEVDNLIKCKCGSPFFSEKKVMKFQKGTGSLTHGHDVASRSITLMECLKCRAVIYPDISYGSSSSSDIKKLQEVLEYFPEVK